MNNVSNNIFKLKFFIDKLGLDYSDNDILGLNVEKVLVNTNKRNLQIHVSSKKIIDYKNLNELSNILSNKLKDFRNICFKIDYKIHNNSNNNKFIEYIWNNIIYIIKTYVPSNSAFINNIDWELDKDSLNIFIEDELILHTIKKRRVEKRIKKFLKKEYKLDLNINFNFNKKENNKKDTHHKIKKFEEKKLLNELNTISNTSNNTINKMKSNSDNNIIYGKSIKEHSIKIDEINSNSGTVIIQGKVFEIDIKEIKGNKKIYIINVTDFTNSITVKFFANKKQQKKFDEKLQEDIIVKVKGNIVYDNYSKELVMIGKSLISLGRNEKTDNYNKKRVELHLHTNMSDMDGISSVEDYVKQASKWGHEAIAITDHGVVQSFPEAMYASKKYGIKILYGLEGYIVDDCNPIVINHGSKKINCDYVVFDIETTGLSPNNDKITEIGAVKIKDGKIVSEYSQLINPERKIPKKISQITGITDEMVYNKPTIKEVLPDFIKFINDSVLVAHNSSFDMGFITKQLKQLDCNLTINNAVLDTLQLTRELFTNLKSHKLNKVADYLDINLKNHHRAVDDSKATAEIFLKCLSILKEKGVKKLEDVNSLFSKNINYKSADSYHIVIFAKNYQGLKNLYKIVSKSHLEYFYRKPRIPKSILSKYRKGLLLGTACEAGELYRAILNNKTHKKIMNIIKFYDYLEIQPIENNMFLVRNEIVKDIDELKDINRKIVQYGEKYNKPVVATGDVHFLKPKDEIFRRIIMKGKGFNDADDQPPLYFRTTNEMIEEFSYLGKQKAEEVVIDNPNHIANNIDDILPIPEGTFPPIIEGSEKELKEMTYKKAKSIYGNPLPQIVKTRLDKELNSIISNGYAVMYIISHKLVKKSLEDGYLVGSRGSVGSSFVATMSDITEVNPLPPHYVCPNCKKSEFIVDGSIGSGVDMEDKKCPECGHQYIKDGYDIPFEVFLGFDGDKEPDIDLNFAGEEQFVAMQYTEKLFGKGHVYRAGTIGSIAGKTAYGFVKKYYDEKEIKLNSAEISRLVNGCSGIKRTTGQHPGGVMVVPSDKEIYDFTPIQYPANKKNSGVITTHFDYHSISGRILKLDILGHDTPSIIRMLEDLTGVDAQKISLDDEKTMQIFTSTAPLGISQEDIDCKVGSLGIPEFGTNFVIQMLIDTKPTTFAELVRISGLSHGTDVWLNNAQDLVKNGITKLSNVISTRDDIMMFLIYNGLDKKRSFTIMEKVRKGKGLTFEEEKYMKDNNIPNWYIDSCKKIKYMFPKAHAVAYVMMSFRIAYFKVHYPQAFYATYFTTKANDFDAQLIVKGKVAVKDKIQELKKLGNEKTAKEKNLLTVLQVALEMYCRGYNFNKVDIYKSDSDKFIIEEDGLLPPLKSLQGVGENAAKSIVKARKSGKFLSIEDIVTRSKATKTVIEALQEHGCLEGMSEKNQLSIFNI